MILVFQNGFRQVHAQGVDSDTYLRISGSKIKRRVTDASRSAISSRHNSEKRYPITPSSAEPLLRAIGILGKNGAILSSMQAKYRQINHFIALTESIDVMHKDELRVIDCGCGKAYLSFALYFYLTEIRGKHVHLVGIDRAADLIKKNRETAGKLNFQNAEFIQSSIADYKTDASCDVLIALHACDTATDDALALAVRTGARAIVAAPCCHHYVNAQLKAHKVPSDVAPLLRDGISRERFADLLTDTMRRDILRCFGYSAELVEFVSPEHTTKNIMIRAELRRHEQQIDHELVRELFVERERFHAAPKLFDELQLYRESHA
jgi:SAM-dependent methyltransferase